MVTVTQPLSLDSQLNIFFAFDVNIRQAFGAWLWQNTYKAIILLAEVLCHLDVWIKMLLEYFNFWLTVELYKGVEYHIVQYKELNFSKQFFGEEAISAIWIGNKSLKTR